MIQKIILGKIIVKILLENVIKFDDKNNFVDDISEYLINKATTRTELAELRFVIERLEGKIEDSCTDIFDFHNIEKERQEELLNIFSESIMKVSEPGEFYKLSLKSDVLCKKICEQGKLDWRFCDSKEKEVLCRLAEHISNIIIQDIKYVPQFEPVRANVIIENLNKLSKRNDEILETLDAVNQKIKSISEKYQDFEREYRNKIVFKNSYIRLFGASDLDSALKEYKLDAAYVDLEMQTQEGEQKISYLDLFEGKRKNLWLSGEAGSGKTTLLSWIAKNAANPLMEMVDGLDEVVPIFIKLREFKPEELSVKKVVETVMVDSTYAIPEGWIEEKIKAGKLLLLIDGVDEVKEDSRGKVFNKIFEMDQADQCIKIFTSRPQVKDRPKNISVKEINMVPMSNSKIKTFIDYWHNAVLEQKSKEEIIVAKNNLFELIEKSKDLRKLAANPLLCAMISALHYKSGNMIPEDKLQLYDDCVKMLLDERDKERKIYKITLSYKQKKNIVAKLATSMMQAECSEISRESAIKKISVAVEDMDIVNLNGDVILSYLIERSGLIREPEIGKISFIHRSFQEYLCAYELNRNFEWDYLKKQIGKDDWNETISIATGFAGKKIAEDLIQTALEKSSQEGEWEKYLLLAIEMSSNATEMSCELRDELRKKLKKIIPPSSKNYNQIAKAGELAIPYLEYKDDFSDMQTKYSLLALKRIGSKEALQAVKTYFVKTLNTDEVSIISDIFNLFYFSDLVQEGIPAVILNNLCKYSVGNAITSFEFWQLLNTLSTEKLDKLDITKLSIIHINENEMDDVLIKSNKLCDKITSLYVNGIITAAAMLSEFHNLKSLILSAENSDFSIYNLKEYEDLNNVEKAKFVLANSDYINGVDLYFLNNVRELELVLNSSKIELFFEYFSELPNLKSLTISGEYAAEYDYSELENSDINLNVRTTEDTVEFVEYKLETININYKVDVYTRGNEQEDIFFKLQSKNGI